MNLDKMKEDVACIVSEGMQHLNFMVNIYRKQILKEELFVHEHSGTAVSWNEKKIVESPNAQRLSLLPQIIASMGSHLNPRAESNCQPSNIQCS